MLSYYKTSSCDAAAGQMDCTRATVTREGGVLFKLATQERVLTLRAGDEPSVLRWVDAINSLKANSPGENPAQALQAANRAALGLGGGGGGGTVATRPAASSNPFGAADEANPFAANPFASSSAGGSQRPKSGPFDDEDAGANPFLSLIHI